MHTPSIPAQVINACASKGLSIAVAESLTGGMLASAFVEIPGASRVFRGGIVAYDTRLKASLLGVDATLLAREGPVHRDVALQMATGVRTECAVAGAIADIGLATTGVAGPGPDPHTGQAAGTVWIAWDIAGVRGAELLALQGDRASIRVQTVERVLQQFLVTLSQVHSGSRTSRE